MARKKILFILTAMLFVLVLSGCGKREKPAGNNSTNNSGNTSGTASKETAPISNEDPKKATETINNLGKDLKNLDDSASSLDDSVSL